jgi:DNA repair exonuclease SbcCD ATPase subunit
MGETPKTLDEALPIIEKLAADLTAATADAEKWKELSRKNEDRAKENFDAVKERDELKKQVEKMQSEMDSGKTEVEKQLEKLAADLASEREARETAEKTAAADRLNAIKTRIGTSKGLPSELIERLSGDDEETIAADADKIIAAFPKGSGAFPDLGQGDKGGKSDTSTADLRAAAGLPPK